MKFEKETLKREEWVLVIGDRRIPINAITAFCAPIFLSLMIIYTMEFGMSLAPQFVSMVSLVSNQGIWDSESHQYIKCVPKLDKTNTLGYGWNCPNITKINLTSVPLNTSLLNN